MDMSTYRKGDNAPMKVELDPGNLLMSMSLWRDVTDMKMPIADHLRVHLMSNKAQNLNNFIATATAWRTVLRGCTPLEPDAQQFADLVREIEAFIEWSKAGLVELRQLALQEAITDGIDRLLGDVSAGSKTASKPPEPPVEGEGDDGQKK
jgi:hypothetical protein